MKSLKKVGALVLAFAMLASTMSAFACANDTFVGFDHFPDNDGKYAKLVMCPQTGTVEIGGYAKKVEWKHAFYEAEYPHRDIEVLVLDGVDTGYTRYQGVNAVVNTKEVAEFWEAKVPYFVYNRLYSDFTGTYKPTTVLKTNFVTAPVVKEWVNVGFDKYVKVGDKVVDYSHEYGKNNSKIDFDWNVLADLEKEYWAANIAGFDAEGKPVFTEDFINGEIYTDKIYRTQLKPQYKMFEEGINNVSWLQLTGPDYANGGTMSFKPFDKIVAGSNPDWYDDKLVSDNATTLTNKVENEISNFLNVKYETSNAKIEWKPVGLGYEMEAPYRKYEVLHINGIPMDGSEVEVIGYEVKKEEVVEVKQDYADEIHLIEKDIELVNETATVEYDYVITPFTTDVTKNVEVVKDYKVVEDYLRETVHAKIPMLPEDDQYEIRFVKVSTEPGKSRLPYIWRYTGGYGEPKVEWKVAFAEAAAPYEIYEEKFVNGIATGIYRSTGEFATSKPSVDTTISQPRVLTVILEADVDGVKLRQKLEDVGYPFIISDGRVNVIVPAELHLGHENNGLDLDVVIDNIVKSCKINVEK